MLLALPWDLFSQVLFGQPYALAGEADVVAMLSNFSGLRDPVPTSGRRLNDIDDDNTGYTPPGDDYAMLRTLLISIMAMWFLWVILCLAGCISPCVVLCVYKQKVHDVREPLTPDDIAAIDTDTDAPIMPPSALDDKFKLFGCFEDIDVCLHGTFCQICRVADTWGTAKVFEFCLGIVVFLVVSYIWFPVFVVLQGIASGIWPQLFEAQKTVDEDVENYLSGRNASEEAKQKLRDLLYEEGEMPVGGQLLVLFSFFVGFVVQAGLFGLLRTQLRQKLGGGKDNKVLLKDALIWGFCPCCATIQEARVVDELNGVRVACCCKLEKTRGNPLVGEATAVAR